MTLFSVKSNFWFLSSQGPEKSRVAWINTLLNRPSGLQMLLNESIVRLVRCKVFPVQELIAGFVCPISLAIHNYNAGGCPQVTYMRYEGERQQPKKGIC